MISRIVKMKKKGFDEKIESKIDFEKKGQSRGEMEKSCIVVSESWVKDVETFIFRALLLSPTQGRLD